MIKPLNDLELYEVLVAAYPEKFKGREENGNDLWNEVIDFAEELCAEMDVDALSDLIGRLVMLASPVESALTGTYSHCLGSTEIRNGHVLMMAAVSREVKQ